MAQQESGEAPRRPGPAFRLCSGVASQIKPNAEEAEQESGEATRRSDSIKAEAESAERESGEAISSAPIAFSDQIKVEDNTLRVDASPGSSGQDGGREPSGERQTPEGSPQGASGGEYQSRGSEGGRVLAGEKVYGGSRSEPQSATSTNSALCGIGRSPSALPTGPAKRCQQAPRLRTKSRLRQNKMAQQESGDAPRRSDQIKPLEGHPKSLRYAGTGEPDYQSKMAPGAGTGWDDRAASGAASHPAFNASCRPPMTDSLSDRVAQFPLAPPLAGARPAGRGLRCGNLSGSDRTRNRRNLRSKTGERPRSP